MTLEPIVLVFLYGSITALATGLGALPFVFFRQISDRALAYANAVASGLMLGASFGLVAEGTTHGRWQTIIGANLGVLFIIVTRRFLRDRDLHFGTANAAGAKQMLLVIIVMTVHSIAEGVAVGAAFGGGMKLAVVITAAIAVHNIPEGLAITTVLRPKGKSIAKCAAWSVFSSIPQPIMAVPAFLFVDRFQSALPYGIGFAAGAMVFMVLVELLPEAYDQGKRHVTALIVTVAMVGMVLFQQYL